MRIRHFFMKNSSKISILFTEFFKDQHSAMTTCCYCLETNNSLVLVAEPDTVECKTCKHNMHTRCYIVAHTRRTLVCNPVDKQAIRCATHDTALTAHDNVQAVRLRYLLTRLMNINILMQSSFFQLRSSLLGEYLSEVLDNWKDTSSNYRLLAS